MYKVSFFTPVGKTSPVRKDIVSLQENKRAKIIKKLKHLEEFGLTRDNPELRKITSTPLWELRILGKDNISIFCCTLANNEIKVLHIIVKKKPKTPVRDINLAVARYQEIINQALDN